MIEITKENFEEEVIKSHLPVVIDFWGPQCVPCMALKPQVEALEGESLNKLKIAAVEAPKNRRLCLQLKVLSLPTFLFYKDGKEVERLSGNVTFKAIQEAAERLV
ncbi:MAG: thioredoxin family protein [Thermodesulfobacteriota bacterium]